MNTSSSRVSKWNTKRYFLNMEDKDGSQHLCVCVQVCVCVCERERERERERDGERGGDVRTDCMMEQFDRKCLFL